MDASDGKHDGITQQPQELLTDFEMKELPVSLHDDPPAAPVSIFGVETSEKNDLAACQLALAQAQRVRRLSVGCNARINLAFIVCQSCCFPVFFPLCNHYRIVFSSVDFTTDEHAVDRGE